MLQTTCSRLYETVPEQGGGEKTEEREEGVSRFGFAACLSLLDRVASPLTSSLSFPPHPKMQRDHERH